MGVQPIGWPRVSTHRRPRLFGFRTLDATILGPQPSLGPELERLWEVCLVVHHAVRVHANHGAAGDHVPVDHEGLGLRGIGFPPEGPEEGRRRLRWEEKTQQTLEKDSCWTSYSSNAYETRSSTSQTYNSKSG